ncbi:MAG: PilZ domain-containing protein [Candidatus Omnitrophota bacterium]
MLPFGERRKHERAQVSLPIKFRKLYGKEFIEEKSSSKDLSETGVRFETESVISPNSRILLEIKIPSNDTIIRTISRVVWIKKLPRKNAYEFGSEFVTDDAKKGHTYEYGNEFLSFQEGSLDTLTDFLQTIQNK